MRFSLFELKEVMYVAQTLLGVFLLFAGLYQYGLASTTVDHLSHLITAYILFIVGGFCVFYGVEIWLLRDDPEIWR